MEVLNVDILTNILSKLDDSKIRILYGKRRLRRLIYNVFASNTFWKKRLEFRLGYEVAFVISPFWFEVYRIYDRNLLSNGCYSSLFAETCKDGQLELVEILLLDDRVNPGFNRNIAFSNACSRGHHEIVDILLKDTRVKPYENFDRDFTGVVERNHLEVLKLLTDSKIPIQSITVESCISTTASKGYVEILKLLLDKFKCLELHKPKTISIFAIACQKGNVEVVKVLLNDSRFDSLNSKELGLELASCTGHVEIVKLLLKTNDLLVRASPDKSIALRNAAYNGHHEIVELLLKDKGVQIHNKDFVLQLFAGGYAEMVKTSLADKKINVEDRLDSLVKSAIVDRKIEFLKLVVGKGLVLNALNTKLNLESLIRDAYLANCIEIVIIASKLANDNVYVKLVEWSCQFNHIALLKVLIANGKKNSVQGNYFSIACDNRNTEILGILLNTPRFVLANDESLFLTALQNDNTDVAKMLIRDTKFAFLKNKYAREIKNLERGLNYRGQAIIPNTIIGQPRYGVNTFLPSFSQVVIPTNIVTIPR